MKKALVLILAITYLVSVTGATVYIQQCMGRTVGWSFSKNESTKCEKCHMSKAASRDCCSSQVKVIKKQVDQSLPKIYTPDLSSLAAILPLLEARGCKVKIKHQNWSNNAISRPPPVSDRQALYCTFLI